MLPEDRDDFQDLLDELDSPPDAGAASEDADAPVSDSSDAQQDLDAVLSPESSAAPDNDLAENADKDNEDNSLTEDIGSDSPSRAESKVELDLDDADFLMEDEPEEEPEPESSALSSLTPDLPVEEKKPEGLIGRLKARLLDFIKTRRKLAIGIGAGIVLLLALLIFLLVTAGGDSAEEDKAVEQPPVTSVRSSLTVSKPAHVDEFIIPWDPMILEYKDASGGNIRFIVIKLALRANDAKVRSEVENKTLILRDAVYYFLTNEVNRLLQNKNNPSIIKPVMLEIINQYLVNGQINDVLFEEFLVK